MKIGHIIPTEDAADKLQDLRSQRERYMPFFSSYFVVTSHVLNSFNNNLSFSLSNFFFGGRGSVGFNVTSANFLQM